MEGYNKVYFHADDYGVSCNQSARILECYTEGVLNSISVIPNVSDLGEGLELLNVKDENRQVRRVLHLNFVEGKPVAPIEQLDMLVDETGYFACSFIKLLKWSYVKRGEERKRLKEQLKLEITAQLERVTQEWDYRITAIDSHQHYHMIPIVMEALMEVIEEKVCEVCEIRISVDPLLPIIKTPSVWFKIPFVNWIKWGILWLHSGQIKRQLSKRKIDSPVFFGMFFTCEMTTDVVEVLLPKYIAYAQKREKCLELMFHPGNLTERTELLDERSKELEDFYMSDNRREEAECLKRLSGIIGN